MADSKKDSKKKDEKPKSKSKASAPTSGKPEKKAAKPPKADKAAKADAAAAEATAPKPEPPKPEPPKREPADPRLKVLKKLQGRYLPRGPLRDRYDALESRWKSGEDHGGVTYDELKSLHKDWRASREKPARASS